MLIRKMNEYDLSEVSKLEKDLFPIAWTINDFEFEVKQNPFSYCYVIENDKKIIGYIVIWIVYDRAEIATIGVDQQFQGQGVGSELLKQAINEANVCVCENITLEVRMSNVKAIGLYKKFGFENKAIRKNYYQDNYEDAYLMEKELGGKL